MKSRTMWFSVALGMFGAAQANLEAIQASISPELYGWITLGIAVAVAGLRAVTTRPLSERK